METLNKEKLQKMKVSELKVELKARKMKVSGKKAELISRLLGEEVQTEKKKPTKRKAEVELDDEELPKKKIKKNKEEIEDDEDYNDEVEDVEDEEEYREETNKNEEGEDELDDEGDDELDDDDAEIMNNKRVPQERNKRVSQERKTKKKEKTTHLDDDKIVSLVQYLKDPGWKELLSAEFKKPYFRQIEKFVTTERAQFEVYPPNEEIFNAFNFTPIEKIKVVIIGQDPYFNPNQAHGLCFSVKKGVKPPPSLVRMYKVLETTCPGFKSPSHGCLEDWAKQGVLMLNATLTVRRGEANSHEKCGWQEFTTNVIKLLCEKKRGHNFFLVGRICTEKRKNY